MTVFNDRADFEQSHMDYYHLERDYPDDQPGIDELEQMDSWTLEAKVNESQECNDYIAESFFTRRIFK